MANVLRAFLDGQEARRQQDAADRLNAMNGYLQQNGQAIFNGDRNALGQLAGFGPEGLNAALDMQGSLDQRAARDEALGMQRERMGWERQDRAKAAQDELTAEQHQAATDAFNALRPYYENGDAEGFRKMVEAEGGDPNVLTMDSFPSAAAKLGIDFKDPRDVALGREKAQAELDTLRNPKPADEYERYKREEEAAGRTPLSRIDFAKAKSPSLAVETLPDGTTRVVQGVGAASSKPLTEGQSKDVGFAARAEPAAATIDQYGDALTGWSGRTGQIAEKAPLGIAKGLQSDNYQLAQQAAHELATTMLRKDSGAVISPSEYEDFYKTYIPQPGDGDALLEQKANARHRMVEGLKAGMTPEAVMKQIGAVAAANAQAPTAGGGDPGSQDTRSEADILGEYGLAP